MNNVEVDAKEVINLFANLTSRQQKQAYKKALRKAAGILNRETRRLLKASMGSVVQHKNRWNGKTLISGVRTKVDKKAEKATIHILGDFRLKFFEMGTEKRHIKKNKANRGKISAIHFFRTAKQNKQAEILNELERLVTESILKTAKK